MDEHLNKIIESDGFARVIVTLKSTGAAATKDGDAIEKFFAAPDEWQGTEEPGRLFSPGVLMQDVLTGNEAARAVSPTRHEDRIKVFPRLGLAIGTVDRAGAASLERSAAVGELIPVEQPRLIRPTRATLAAAAPGVSWGVQKIRAPELWEMGHTGEGVIVGHVDTGVDHSHPALQGAIAAFARMELNGDLTEGDDPFDSGDHGTHTAGTIVGRSGAHGTFGVAPGAKLVSAMVIEGGDVITRIIGGIEWAIEQGARVMSASLGLRGSGPAFRALVNGIRANNVLPVFAVGNEGPNTSRYPGNYQTVLSVGAVDEGDKVAWFSGSQSFGAPTNRIVPDLCAPGVEVVSCIPGGKLAEMDGSSMATPHIAGLAALLLSAEPDASIADIESAIVDSCVKPVDWDAQRGGAGVPDAVEALRILRGGTGNSGA